MSLVKTQSSSGILQFSRGNGYLTASVLAGQLDEDWLSLGGESGPLSEIGQQLRLRQDPMATHWIFGGADCPEGVASLALTAGRSEEKTEVSLKIYNQGAEGAVLTVYPCAELPNPSVHAQSHLQAIEQSFEGFALTDPAGRFIYMNRAHLRMFGYEELAEITGQPWRILYEEDQANRIEREAFPVLISQKHWHGLTQARRKDGSTFSEDLTLSMLPDGGIACNCRDRTMESELRERLERSEALFRGFTENVPAGVFIKKPDGLQHFVNRQAAAFFGATPDQIIGRMDSEIFPADVVRSAREHDTEVLHGDTVLNFEFTTAVGGTEHTFDSVKFPLRGKLGEVEFICAVYNDVTERKQLERERVKVTERQTELMMMHQEFISLISHEFRTPLAAIQSAHYLMAKRLEGAADDRMVRYLELQGQSIRTLKGLADQVIFLNRLEYSDSRNSVKPTPVLEHITSVVERLNEMHNSPQERISLSAELPPDLSALIDPSLFRVALENIISNAAKYSALSKEVRVEVSLQGERLCIGVTDRGEGIPQAEQRKLFSPFFRASNVGNIPGAGLGLIIAKRVVDYHGGQIEFESSKQQGTTFRLYFPLSR